MRYGIIGLLLFVLLTGCTKELSEKAIALTAPDVVEYDKPTQLQASREMTAHCRIVTTLCQMIIDYGVMRDQARAATGKTVDIQR